MKSLEAQTKFHKEPGHNRKAQIKTWNEVLQLYLGGLCK